LAVVNTLASYQDVLQFIGAFVAFSIAYVSYRGLKETQSPALLRLATAFFFLGFGFVMEGLVGVGEGALIPGLAAFTATLFVAGLILETTGYFFLAFSHVIDVLISKRIGLALLLFPVVTVSGAQFGDILRLLSFYFVLYGVVETLYAYARNRKPDTFLIATGLALIAGGTLAEWLSLLNPAVNVLSLVQIIMKEVGLLILFVPVLNFTFRRNEKWNGPV
jgi:hypothetical protein